AVISTASLSWSANLWKSSPSARIGRRRCSRGRWDWWDRKKVLSTQYSVLVSLRQISRESPLLIFPLCRHFRLSPLLVSPPPVHDEHREQGELHADEVADHEPAA